MAISAERLSGLHAQPLPTDEVCEWCEQPIPPERIADVRGRIAARERARANELTNRLREQFGRELIAEATRYQAQLDAARAEAAADSERIRTEGRQREDAVRAEATAAAEAAAVQRLTEAENVRRAQEVQWQARWEQLLSERSAAEQANSALRSQIGQLRLQAEEVEKAASARDASIRAEARLAAEREIEERVTAAADMHSARELQLKSDLVAAAVARENALATQAGLVADLARERDERQAAVDSARREGEAIAVKAQEEGARAAQAEIAQAQQQVADLSREIEALRLAGQQERAAAVAEVNARLARTEEQRVETEKAHRETQHELQVLKDSQATTVQNRLSELRDSLTKEKDKAVLDTEARTFNERQQLQKTVQTLTRQLETMTAQARGEGAEIDLYEALKGAFEGDRIRRVPRGVAGPDIFHEVVRNAKVCGKIVYEAKNRNDYKSSYATKLLEDQRNLKAEFAVLSTNHFPPDVSQLHTHQSVIVACPARVVTIAQILRRHLLQLHDLRVSTEERDAKTEALYKFITSEQCRQIFEKVDKLVADLMELDVFEQKAHKSVWEKRGRLLTSVLKSFGDLDGGISRVIGTAD